MTTNNNGNGNRALIMTVGLSNETDGHDIVDALMLDIRACKPDRVVLASTDRSRPIADALAERAGKTVPEVEHLALVSAHDLDFIFTSVRTAIRRLMDEGYESENISVNYATGTKVMACGSVLAAVFGGCGSLRYVKTGSAGSPTDRLISTPATGIFANRDLSVTIMLLKELRFHSASRILNTIRIDFLNQEERQMRDSLIRLSEAYAAWNGFEISKFLSLYQSVSFGHKALESFRLSNESLSLVEDVARAFEDQRPSRLICLELFNSAERSYISGYYNDAVARLYRAMELLAQQRLMDEQKIDADNVDIHKVPPRYRPEFEALRSLQDGRIRLGLRKAYDLLYRLEDELGVHFVGEEQMPLRLDERRSALLAHGVEPINAERCEAFFNWTDSFCRRHIQDFEKRRRLIQFPWLQTTALPAHD